MQSNSTEALLQLWHMCVKSQGHEESDSEGPVLQWETLRKVMAGLPMARTNALRSGVDDILQRHFGASRRRAVNFTLFWRGMEAILKNAGVFNNTGFSEEILEVIDSLRHFRDLLPELHGETLSVQPLRQIYARLAQSTSQVVCDYWTAKLQDLPDDEVTMVSADEIAFALLKWLEELLGCDVDASEDEALDEPEQERQPQAVLRLAMPQEATSSAGWSWLGRASDPEVTSFRQRMLRLLPSDGEHALLHFYRAVRDAMDAGQIGSPCSHERLRVTRASLRGGVALLERVAMREVRGAFRQLQRASHRPSLVRGDSALAPRPSTPRSEGCGIMAGLVCSQALAAQVLDRRANLAPRAFYMAWLLERARRRCLVSVLSIFRSKLARKESPSRRLGRPKEAVPKEVPLSSPSRRVLARSKTPTKTAIV